MQNRFINLALVGCIILMGWVGFQKDKYNDMCFKKPKPVEEPIDDKKPIENPIKPAPITKPSQ